MRTLCLQGGVCAGGVCYIECAGSASGDTEDVVVWEEAQTAGMGGEAVASEEGPACGYVDTMVLLRG